MPKPERSRSHGVFWLVAFRFLIIFLQLISVKISWNVLGLALVGVTQGLATIRSLWQFVDLDVPQGLNQVLARTIRVDEKKAWDYFQSGLFLQLVIAIIGCIGMFLGPFYLPTFFEELRSLENLQLLCILCGLQFFFDTVGSTYNAPFNAREQFAKLAALTSYVPIFSIGLGIGLVYWMKSPVAILLGTLIDSILQFILKLGYIILKEKNFPILPKVDIGCIREIISVSLRSYVAGLSTRIAGTFDRLIIFKYLGGEANAVYSLACRIPQILLEAYGKIVESITPEMTHLAANEPHRLEGIFRRNFKFIGFVAGIGIMFVCGFGDIIFRAWMAREYPGFGLLVFLMGIYYGLELHHSTITRVFFAQGKAHYMLPFTLWNTLVTLTMTKYLAVRFGLVGAAAMNCFIDVAQIIPIHYYCSKYGVKEISLKELLIMTASVIGLGIVFGLVALMISSQFRPGRWAYALVVIIPFLCVLLAALYKRLGLIELPNGIVKMVKKTKITQKLFAITS